MFSTIVAGILFAGSSFALLAIIYLMVYETFFQSELSMTLERLQKAQRGYRSHWSPLRVAIIFAVWSASRIYLWD